VTQTALRLSLLGRSIADVGFDPLATLAAFGRGFWFDGVTMGFFLIPMALYLWILPDRLHTSKADRRIDTGFRFLFCFLLLYDAVAEHLFWTEFTTRFNFIAVDYLVYTTEVIGNIVESYPIHWFVLAVVTGAVCMTWISNRFYPVPPYIAPNFRIRTAIAIACIALTGVGYGISSADQFPIRRNAEAHELGGNGIYTLFAAFWNNEINYDAFYTVRPEKDVIHAARTVLAEPNAHFLKADGRDMTRRITRPGLEHHKNVMLVVMESMSAEYMESFGSPLGITPNLDSLAKEGLFFTNLYATGTRTVRGLEAVTLSIPPTPGQSIVRRPENSNLYSLGFVFQDRGYDTRFIYGGYGYFDNMNAFFAGNGFDIVDRTVMPKDEINFANVWGVCDEDMFTRALKEADASVAAGKPFFHLIMTTSNHRPYTYPEGRIDLPSKSGRTGGVKYSDYAVGKLIEDAKKKPWFKDTVFVFVADHTAGAGGKAELDPRKYHIPMIIYAPDFIAPQRYDITASQIDFAPTLLGLLNFSYDSKFYGHDVLQEGGVKPRTFVSNFQKVALAQDGMLTVLSPRQQSESYVWPTMQPTKGDDAHLMDAIAYYQSASWWRETLQRIPSVVREYP
jgi:phosphoglycerol transferase MdoB-like AlkP superfamily enzyme